jgi:hypothetical protein
MTSGNANDVYVPKWLLFLHNLHSKSLCSCNILVIVLHNLDRKNHEIRRDRHWTGDPRVAMCPSGYQMSWNDNFWSIKPYFSSMQYITNITFNEFQLQAVQENNLVCAKANSHQSHYVAKSHPVQSTSNLVNGEIENIFCIQYNQGCHVSSLSS